MENENVNMIFFYKDQEGTIYWTPSKLLAYSRVESLGTEGVWVQNFSVN